MADAGKKSQSGGLTQWIDYIRYSLADIVVRGEWDDFGIFRFLNRISFMSCDSLIFLIHHEERPGQIIVDEEVSVFDPYLQGLFDFALRDHGFVSANGEVVVDLNNVPKRQLIQDRLRDYAIRMFDTNNSIIAFQIETGKSNKVGVSPETTFNPIKNTSETGDFLTRVLRPFDGKEGRMGLGEHIEPHFSKLRKSGSYIRAADIPPDKQGIIPEDMGWVKVLYASVIHMVDKEFHRLSKSPLIRSFTGKLHDHNGHPSDNHPINIAFFSKIFSRTTTRCPIDPSLHRFRHRAPGYLYDSAFVMGGNQVYRILEGLRQACRKDFIKYRAKSQSDQFWSMQASPEGQEKIILILRSPLPQHVRLFNENTLMSGITMIAPDVFANGGVGWIEGRVSPQEREASLLHLACLHYVLQLCSPKRPIEAKHLSIVSLPFRCSGGIWMCASFLRENQSGEYAGLINQKGFEETYCIYHSLIRESERRLRRLAKFAYLKLIGQLAAYYASDTRNRHSLKRGETRLDHIAIQEFNRAARNLARIYPFLLTQIKDELDKEDNIFLPVEKVDVEECKNPFFDRLSLRSFIDRGDIIREIRSCMLLEARAGGVQ